MDFLALPFFFMPLFLFTIILSLNTFSSNASSHVSYTDQCASLVPNSTPNNSNSKVFPHGQRQRGYYYLGGGTIYPHTEEQNHVTLQINNVYETDVVGLLSVEAWLTIQSATWYYSNCFNDGNFTDASMWNYNPFPQSITFWLEGFWSESSGKLCMVGTESDEYSLQLQRLEVVLKLYNVFNSSNTISTLVTGSLESLSSKQEVSYFEHISLFIFPRMDYEYTLDTKEAKNEYADEGELVPGLSINPVKFCSNLYPMIYGKYDLLYQSECISAKNCSPVGGDVNQLPYIVSLKALVCSDVKQRVKVLMGFGKIHFGSIGPFNPNATLVGEGWWDEKRNQLCIVACHFLGMEESMASVHVGDCSARMILRFPKIWSINDTSRIVGQIWSNKTERDSGYFKRVNLRSRQGKTNRISGIKYEYSQLDKVRKLCPRQEPLKNKGTRYPNVYSSEMRFDMLVKYSNQTVYRGYFVPFVVNDQIQKSNLDGNSVPFVVNYRTQRLNFLPKSYHKEPFISKNSSSKIGLYNVSYQISFSLTAIAQLGDFTEEKSLLSAITNGTASMISVSAEGVYDAEAGSLCMLGCRNLGSEKKILTTDSVDCDCEILIKIQFQEQNAKSNGVYIKGSIESIRKSTDPLYFNSLDLTSVACCSCCRSLFCQILKFCFFLFSCNHVYTFIMVYILLQ